MAIRILRLGTAREKGEGLRIGTVRRPPRGVAKERIAADHWYDVWLPQLAPSADATATNARSCLSSTSDVAGRYRRWDALIFIASQPNTRTARE